MAWRSSYSKSSSPITHNQQTPPTQNAAKKKEQKEPDWVSVLPAASGLWSMIVTFRERGSDDIADKLEAAAEKQAEAHLRTQQLMNKQKPPGIRIPINPIPVRNIKSRSPTPAPAVMEVESNKRDSIYSQYSMASESEWDSEGGLDRVKREAEEIRDKKMRRRKLSVRLEPPSPQSSSSAASPRSISPISPIPLMSPTQGETFLKPSSLTVKNPHSCYHNRLKTYERSKFRWDSPSPSELSEAGFYFIGPRDNVQCFSCETCQNCWKPAEDPWIRHTRRSPSCDYLIETRGADFISAIINKVEKVKNGIMNSYSRSNSSTSIKGAESEFSKMKLRETKTPSSSGWRLDPYKERGVGSASTKNSVKRKKKVR